MILDNSVLKSYEDNPEGLAELFLGIVLGKEDVIRYPINPFAILSRLSVPFVFRNFTKLEGVLISENNTSSDALVAINANRPVQRQRFSCAHEICHLIKDVGNYDPFSCVNGARTRIERYAESFASCLLMPRHELKKQIEKYFTDTYLSFDDVLTIAEYFGTSFSACILRIKKCFPSSLSPGFEKKANKFQAQRRRHELGFSNVPLYSQIIDCWENAWTKTSDMNASFAFKNRYIYNDMSIEGIKVDENVLAEEITTERVSEKGKTLPKRNLYEVMGESSMYDYVFSKYDSPTISIYQTATLNSILFSKAPFPEFGGRTRTQNTYVLGAKFETSDHTEIMPRLIELNKKVDYIEKNRTKLCKSSILKQILSIHHELTVIHPYYDGNGRTSRAFMNLQLLRYGLPPVSIDIKEREDYILSLEDADISGNIDKLFSFMIEQLIQSHANYFS